MNRATPGLGRGERASDFVLLYQDGTPTRFYARAGGSPSVLLFYDDDELDQLLRFCDALNDSASGAVSIFTVRGGQLGEEERDNPQVSRQVSGEGEMPCPVFWDTEGIVRRAYRLAPEETATVFVLDPNLRVLASLCLQEPGSTAQKVISILDDSLPQVVAMEIKTQAPVLLVPNVLDQEICQYLIDVWETQGNIETGVEQSYEDRRQETISPDSKRRRDHIVNDKKLLRLLSSTVGSRLMPEVQRAFAFKATRFEGFKIACYDAAAGGFFHAHRDNLSPSTAHRRFALTLNLNEGYEGGHLRFPEYGPHLYRPEAGGALVFSCSLLHEVTEVEVGRRFALLSFLFGQEDVATSRAESKGKSSTQQQ